MKSQAKFLPFYFSLLFLLCASPFLKAANAANNPVNDLDGDHFSLEGALEFFKTAESLEAFEQMLNTSDNPVNNLDLNEDGTVDYLRIEDYHDGEVHAIAIQAIMGTDEMQDVAVIEIEKTGKETAMLQIVGDENLYGSIQIIEPTEIKNQFSPNGSGGPNPAISSARVIVNVWGWPSVRLVYRPTYRAYVSPFRWRRYPNYYRPWRPRTVTVFRANIVPRPHYRVATTHRVVRAHRVYTPQRRSSVVVHKRTNARVATRTTTTRVNNNRVGAQKRTTTTVTKRRNGPTTVTKTTTKANKRNNAPAKATRTTTSVNKSKKGTKVSRKKTTVKRKK